MNKIKKNKRVCFLIIYGLIIGTLFIYIVFLAPERLFIPKEEIKGELFFALTTMQKELLQNPYEYKMNILNSIGTETTIYKCNGKKIEDKEEGSCTSPKEIKYDEKTKIALLKPLNNTYLQLESIFALIENIYPEVEIYQKTRIYKYSVNSNTLKTEIQIITNRRHILEIRINNAYESYNISYNLE